MLKNTMVFNNRMVVKKFVRELDLRGLSDRREKKYVILLRKFSHVQLARLPTVHLQL